MIVVSFDKFPESCRLLVAPSKEAVMAVSSAFGKKAAKKFLSQQKNIPENWLLGILPRDVVTRDRIYSMKVTNPDSAEDDHITILVIMITDGAPPKILEDYREKYQHLWS